MCYTNVISQKHFLYTIDSFENVSDRRTKYLLLKYCDILVLKMSHHACETTPVTKIKTTFGLSFNSSAMFGSPQTHTYLSLPHIFLENHIYLCQLSFK